MKKISILLLFLVLFDQMAMCQNVTSARVEIANVEQSGEKILITYKILNSNPGQLFSIKVLGSLNGGTEMPLLSVTGDAGGSVAGGKSEYTVVWDALKDVDEVRSAEFIVRAELISEVIRVAPAAQDPKNQQVVEGTRWDKKRFNALSNIGFPGTKFGATLGYIGNWGIYLKVVSGKSTKADDADSNANPLDIPSFPAYSGVVTKRILNKDAVQLHLALGVASSKFVFYEKVNTSYTYTYDMLAGPEVGLVLGFKGASAMITYSHYNPGSVIQDSNLNCWSVIDFFDIGFGVRF